MEHRNAVTEVRTEAAHRLRRQRNFRDEDDGGLASRQRLLQGANVDLRFPAPRDAVEQKRYRRLPFYGFRYRIQRVRLGGVQRYVLRRIDCGAHRIGRALDFNFQRLDPPLFNQPFHRGVRCAAHSQGLGLGDARTRLCKRLNQGLLLLPFQLSQCGLHIDALGQPQMLCRFDANGRPVLRLRRPDEALRQSSP